MRYLFLLIWVVFSVSTNGYAQKTNDAPKLVVGIVVDQMKDEYLHRYADRYSKDGFLRLMNDGFYAANHQFSYMPTITAPGHASVFTGTTPAVHGIVNNNWYNPQTKKDMYCVGDDDVNPVGIDNDGAKRSPRNLKTTTITDELKLFWNFKSKVIGVSLKDRGAILPAGHLADGAYWFMKGKFVTSSYYMNQLPKWVDDFNNSDLIDNYIKEGWKTLYDVNSYKASLPDDNPYEWTFEDEERPVFPRNLKELAGKNGDKEIIVHTHFGNTIVLEFALKALENEQLGEGEVTDFLTVSFSSTDVIGHEYGTRAIETEDAYLRLDADIARLLNALDKKFGKDNYIVFLTADHGGAEVAQFSIDNNLPGGYIDKKALRKEVEKTLKTFDEMGLELVERMEGNRIYFAKEKVAEAKLNLYQLSTAVAKSLDSFPGIYKAYVSDDVLNSGSSQFPLQNLYRGIHPHYASDVIYLMESGWMNYGKVGTTHGLPYKYDTHAPFLLYGKGVKPGVVYRETNIRDIAPTLSMLLNIPFPSGTTGQPIVEAIK